MGRQKLKCCANFADETRLTLAGVVLDVRHHAKWLDCVDNFSIQIKGTVEGRAMGGVGLVLCEDHGCNCYNPAFSACLRLVVLMSDLAAAVLSKRTMHAQGSGLGPPGHAVLG